MLFIKVLLYFTKGDEGERIRGEERLVLISRIIS